MSKPCSDAAAVSAGDPLTNKNIVNFGKRVAMNTPIQGTAADIIKIAMIKVYRRLKAEQLCCPADFAGTRRADCRSASARA